MSQVGTYRFFALAIISTSHLLLLLNHVTADLPFGARLSSASKLLSSSIQTIPKPDVSHAANENRTKIIKFKRVFSAEPITLDTFPLSIQRSNENTLENDNKFNKDEPFKEESLLLQVNSKPLALPSVDPNVLFNSYPQDSGRPSLVDRYKVISQTYTLPQLTPALPMDQFEHLPIDPRAAVITDYNNLVQQQPKESSLNTYDNILEVTPAIEDNSFHSANTIANRADHGNTVGELLHSSSSDEHNRGNIVPGIPGQPWTDYPMFSQIPVTSFNCQRAGQYGYYADVEAGCQVWHYCQPDGRHSSFLCPNGTMFNQLSKVCDWWYNVRCIQMTIGLQRIRSITALHRTKPQVVDRHYNEATYSMVPVQPHPHAHYHYNHHYLEQAYNRPLPPHHQHHPHHYPVHLPLELIAHTSEHPLPVSGNNGDHQPAATMNTDETAALLQSASSNHHPHQVDNSDQQELRYVPELISSVDAPAGENNDLSDR